jgi:hypothetical protein
MLLKKWDYKNILWRKEIYENTKDKQMKKIIIVDTNELIERIKKFIVDI